MMAQDGSEVGIEMLSLAARNVPSSAEALSSAGRRLAFVHNLTTPTS